MFLRMACDVTMKSYKRVPILDWDTLDLKVETSWGLISQFIWERKLPPGVELTSNMSKAIELFIYLKLSLPRDCNSPCAASTFSVGGFYFYNCDTAAWPPVLESRLICWQASETDSSTCLAGITIWHGIHIHPILDVRRKSSIGPCPPWSSSPNPLFVPIHLFHIFVQSCLYLNMVRKTLVHMSTHAQTPNACMSTPPSYLCIV